MVNRLLLRVKDTEDVNKLIFNFLYLVLTNGINFVMPLLIVPILLKRLGVDKFGLVMMGQALMSFFVLITEYNFNNTGTQLASVNRNSLKKLEFIFNRILTTRIFLLFVTFILLFVIVMLYPKFYNEKKLFILSFGMVVGKVMLPIWFFQGIEKMKFIALSNFIAKIFLTSAIVLIITKESSYIYVNLMYAIGDIIAGVISLVLVKKIVGVKITILSYKYIKKELKSGWQLFFSSLSINTYVNSNIIILGALTNSSTAGIYSIAEKSMLLVKQLASILLQTSFPHACKLAVTSDKALKNFLKNELYLFSVIFFLLAVSMYSQAEKICIFFNGESIIDTIYYIKLFSVVPLIVSINMPAYQILVINEVKKGLLIINFFAAFISLVLNFTLVPSLSALGTVITIIITESIVTISLYMLITLKNKSLKFI